MNWNQATGHGFNCCCTLCKPRNHCTICTCVVGAIDGEQKQDAQGAYWQCKDIQRCAENCERVFKKA